MKKALIAAFVGTVSGAIVTTQVAAPLLAQEAAKTTNVYQQLDLFGEVQGVSGGIAPVSPHFTPERSAPRVPTSTDSHSTPPSKVRRNVPLAPTTNALSEPRQAMSSRSSSMPSP